MAFGSTLVVVAAVLASLAPANGFLLDRLPSMSLSGNKATGTGGSGSGSGTPPSRAEMGVRCYCDEPPALACHCGVAVDATLMGKRVAFDPKVNVKFVPSNVSVVMTVDNQGQTLYTNVISAEKAIPPVCVTVPQFPFVGLCSSINNLSVDLEKKSLSFCSALTINTMPVGLPKPPTVPIGCFSAGVKDGIKYTAPDFKVPAKGTGTGTGNLVSDNGLNLLPSPFDNFAPFDAIKQAIQSGWPFGGSGNKPEAQLAGGMTAGLGNGANLQANGQVAVTV